MAQVLAGETLEVAGARFRVSLNRVRDGVLAGWAAATALRLRDALASSTAPDGSPLAPNTPSTSRHKARRGQDPRPGVRTGALLRGLPSAVRVLDGRRAEVYGSDGKGTNDIKVNVLIKGRKGRKGRRRKVSPQVPRDFVGHDEKVVEKTAELALQAVANAWGFI